MSIGNRRNNDRRTASRYYLLIITVAKRSIDTFIIGSKAGLKRTERLEWFESEAMNRVYAMRDELCAEHPGRF